LLQLLDLPPEQRAKRCREHAADATRYAAYAHEPAMKQVFARIAEQWIELADTAEAEIKTPDCRAELVRQENNSAGEIR
jgi:hypothetical protein